MGWRLRSERTAAARSGSVSVTGEFLHGPANERFLYISFRRPGHDAWARRTKILLPNPIGGHVLRLSAEVLDVGKSRVVFEQNWTATPDG